MSSGDREAVLRAEMYPVGPISHGPSWKLEEASGSLEFQVLPVSSLAIAEGMASTRQCRQPLPAAPIPETKKLRCGMGPNPESGSVIHSSP